VVPDHCSAYYHSNPNYQDRRYCVVLSSDSGNFDGHSFRVNCQYDIAMWDVFIKKCKDELDSTVVRSHVSWRRLAAIKKLWAGKILASMQTLHLRLDMHIKPYAGGSRKLCERRQVWAHRRILQIMPGTIEEPKSTDVEEMEDTNLAERDTDPLFLRIQSEEQNDFTTKPANSKCTTSHNYALVGGESSLVVDVTLYHCGMRDIPDVELSQMVQHDIALSRAAFSKAIDEVAKLMGPGHSAAIFQQSWKTMRSTSAERSGSRR
jgi:hypothetical protein